MHPDVDLRRAGPADAAHAARIIADALAEFGLPFEPHNRDADVAIFGSREDHDDLVAEKGDRPIGIVSIGPHGDPGVGWISKLFVVKDARMGGIGRMLLEAAHDAARQRGYSRIGLRTRVVFTAAIALYERAGYVQDTNICAQEYGDLVYFRPLEGAPSLGDSTQKR